MRWIQDEYHDIMGMNLGKAREDGRGQEGLVCCSPWATEQPQQNLKINDKTPPACSEITTHLALSLDNHLRELPSIKIPTSFLPFLSLKNIYFAFFFFLEYCLPF